jgi:hypothetical protein
VEATPEVERRLSGADCLIPFSAIQNFSYRVMHIGGDGFCMVGDAAGFLDPIFSTGFFIGTTTGASAAQDVIEALARRSRVETSDFGPTIALTRTLHRIFFAHPRILRPRFLRSSTPATTVAAARRRWSPARAHVVRPGTCAHGSVQSAAGPRPPAAVRWGSS